jgi:hypothetical protein
MRRYTTAMRKGQRRIFPKEITRYYDEVAEEERLAMGASQLEFARTKEVVLRYLTPPPATILDVGGAAGAYALWWPIADITCTSSTLCLDWCRKPDVGATQWRIRLGVVRSVTRGTCRSTTASRMRSCYWGRCITSQSPQND